jgi:hypothetical protein
MLITAAAFPPVVSAVALVADTSSVTAVGHVTTAIVRAPSTSGSGEGPNR